MFEIQRSANLKIFEDAHLQICYLDDLELLKLTTCPMVSVIAGSFNLKPPSSMGIGSNREWI